MSQSKKNVTFLWSPSSWRNKPCSQQVIYADPQKLTDVLGTLANNPPLVSHLEIECLRKQLAEAAEGKRFLLQGGDCAESFAECNAETIANKFKIILQMSLILFHGLRKPIIRVGRIAGQYAKPRSELNENREQYSLPSYRGDLINSAEYTPSAREPDPQRLLTGYSYSAYTLNYIRSLVDGGFADLHHPEYWNLDFVKHSPLAKEYKKIVADVQDTFSWMQQISGVDTNHITRPEFFTSHENLHLAYEQALTRQVDGCWYNLSTHFPWFGKRTAQLGGAHLEFARGIANPIAVKIGPGVTDDYIQSLIALLNPDNIPGRLTLIHRFGSAHISSELPRLISAVQQTKSTVLWSCDPMHGNTKRTQDGRKTRHFQDILHELEMAFQIHQHLDAPLGAVHFELTGENVTECIGGARGLSEADLQRDYQTLVDPRLNYEQALEMAMLIVRLIKEKVATASHVATV